MELSVPSSILNQIHDELVQGDGQERFAYVYCGRSGDRLLAGDYDVIDDNQLREQSGASVRPRLDVERDTIQNTLQRGRAPLMMHSHPFTDIAGFSGIDVGTMDSYRDWLTGLAPGTPFGFAVVAREDLETTVFSPDQDGFVELPVDVLGEWRLDHDLTGSTTTAGTGTSVDRDRYDRNIRAITADGQQQIHDTAVAVVGCGGIGSVLVEELARLGVRKLTLVDPDHVEDSNLPRLVGAFPEHTGRPKVEVLKQHVWHVSPDTEVDTYQAGVEDVTDRLIEADVITTGVDSVAARSVVNEHSVRHLQPWIDTGVIIDAEEDSVQSMRGTVQVVVPGVTGCYHCTGRHDPEQARIDRLDEHELQHEIEQGYVEADVATPEPAIIHLNTTIAGLAVQEFTKLVAGFDQPRGLIQFDALTYETRPMKTRSGEDCPVCSSDAVLGAGELVTGQVEDEPADTGEVPVSALE